MRAYLIGVLSNESIRTSKYRPLFPPLFVVAAGTIAFLLVRYLAPIERAAGFFAVLMIIVSLLVSRTVLIDRTLADRVYYLAAAIAVAVIFAYEAPKRLRIDFLVAYRATELSKENAEKSRDKIKRDRTLAEGIARMPSSLYAAVRQFVVGAEDYHKMTANSACVEALGGVLDLRPRLDEDVGRQQLALSMCKVHHEYLQRPEWEGAKRIGSMQELEELRPFLRVVGSGQLRLDGAFISFPELEKLLPSENPTTQLAALEKELTDRINKYASELVSLTSTFGLFAEEIKAADKFGMIVQWYWPFLLISLLGLKLARGP